MTDRSHALIVLAALLALFLGAMDALVVSAAMPTIIADLGGLELYAWVYSAYFLARAVSLPIFGKLCDLYDIRRIFLATILLFTLSSAAAGAAPNMGFLIAARVFQGIGAGGNFALVYIVLSVASAPEHRAKTLSFASSIWGISSVIGPTLGGFIVTWFSWRWIFFLNLPLGVLSLAGIGLFLTSSDTPRQSVKFDLAGVFFLCAFILTLLTLFMTAGRTLPWQSLPAAGMIIATLVFFTCFVFVEKRAPDPILDLSFFKRRGFALGNAASFFASFAIFSLFAYAPLFVQGALGKNPMQVGLSMLSLSLGWSLGSLVLGRIMHLTSRRVAAATGAGFMVAAAGLTLMFSSQTGMMFCFFAFFIMGIGMGFVTLSTLLEVQHSLSRRHLGVATSTHQFARTLGGAIGVGIGGGVVTGRLLNELASAGSRLPPALMDKINTSMEHVFSAEFQAALTPELKDILAEAISTGVSAVFVIVLGATLLSLAASLGLKTHFSGRQKG